MWMFLPILWVGVVNCAIVEHQWVRQHLTIVERAHDAAPNVHQQPFFAEDRLIDDVYRQIHATPQSLITAIHWLDVVPAVPHAVISGAILCMWFPVMKLYLQEATLAIDVADGDFMRALPSTPPTIGSFQKHTTSTGHVLRAFHKCLDTIQAEIQGYIVITAISYRMEERPYTRREIISAWWSSYDNVVLMLDTAIHHYALWRTTLAEWVDYTTALGISRETLAIALHQDFDRSIYADDILETAPLTQLTEIFLSQIEYNRFFHLSPTRSVMPYAIEIPVILETASPTKMAQLYCKEFSCTEAMQNVINVVDYSTYPNVLHELTHHLTEERRWMDKNELSVTEQNSRLVSDTYRYTMSLPAACRVDAHARLLCDMCGYYMTPIQFYLSQMDILHDYRNDLPYLLDLLPIQSRSIFLDFDRFNDLLSGVYRDVSPFFGIQDSLLSFWLMKEWKKAINDLYVLFREDKNLWKSTPPKTLTNDHTLAAHQVDLEAYPLQAYWRRFFQIIKSNRANWWASLLQVASAYDMYTQKTPSTQHLYNPLALTMQCRNSKSIFDCITLLHQRFTDPDITALFNEQLQRALLVRSNHLHGRLDVYEAMAARLKDETHISFKSRFKKWIHPGSPTNDPLLLPPQLPTLLSDNELLHSNSRPYPIRDEEFNRIFTVDAQGNMLNAAGPSRNDAQEPRVAPRLKTKKSLWRQLHT